MGRSRLALSVVMALVTAALAPPVSAIVRPARSGPAVGQAVPPSTGPIRLGYCGGDDWEPALARDGRYVYVAITHYVGDTTCDLASGGPQGIYLQVSSDGGRAFGPPRAVSSGPIGGLTYTRQADPSVAVDPSGNVYVAFLGYGINGGHTDVIVAKSTDHGASFAPAVRVNAKGCKNCDHEKIVSAGAYLYVAYTQASQHFISMSADGGASWTQSMVLSAGVVAFAEDAVVDGSGNVYVAWADCRSSACTGVPAVDHRVSKTPAGSLSTTFTSVATAVQGPDCPFKVCGFAYWSPQDDIAIDAAGTLYLAWGEGQDPGQRRSPPIVSLSRSTDGGATWSFMGRADDKTALGCGSASCYALFPTVVAGPSGTVHVAWMDDRNGAPIDHRNGFNLWLRTSTSGGVSWSGPSQRISTYDPAQAQSFPNGFLFPYGDYFGLTLDRCGAPMLTWGEGQDWAGGPSAPGHVEFLTLC